MVNMDGMQWFILNTVYNKWIYYQPTKYRLFSIKKYPVVEIYFPSSLVSASVLPVAAVSPTTGYKNFINLISIPLQFIFDAGEHTLPSLVYV